MTPDWIDRLAAKLHDHKLNAEVIVLGGARLRELDTLARLARTDGGRNRVFYGVPVLLASGSAPSTLVEIHYRNWDGLPGFDMLDITG